MVALVIYRIVDKFYVFCCCCVVFGFVVVVVHFVFVFFFFFFFFYWYYFASLFIGSSAKMYVIFIALFVRFCSPRCKVLGFVV